MNAPRGAAARPALVSFDCWNTLLQEKSWPTAHGLRVDALVSASEAAGRPVRRAAAEAAFDAAWQRHMVLWSDGVASGARDVAGWALATLGARPAPQAFERLVARYEEASHSSQVRALPGARETLAALGFAGVHRVLICDTGLTPGRVVRRHLAREGLLGHLQVLVFSDEVGVPKPAREAFDAALAPLGVAPSRALHVGDLRRTDVAGARAAGMRSVRIREPHDDASPLPDADHVVPDHAALRRLLGV